jgi:hypothetical protein
VPSALDDIRGEAGRPRRRTAGLVLCVLAALLVAALAVTVVVLRRPHSAVLPGTGARGGAARPGADVSSDARGNAASSLLGRLTADLQRRGRVDLTPLVGAGHTASSAELGALRHNVRAMRLTDLSMRYVEDGTDQLSAGQRRALGPHAWVATVQVSWRVGGYDVHRSTREVALTLRDTGTRELFVTARRGYGDPSPLWLLERLQVRRTRRSLVAVAAPGGTARFAGLADRAVADVRRVLPAWRGRLVVEVPRDQTALDHVMGAGAGSYDEIAAVTTTADGSQSRSAPVHIFVNPAVFDPLGPRGAQIVMSHEATHVATGAALSTMPTWLLEGFADYVALDHVDLPPSVTASQILRQVRRTGAPAHLPGKAEFDAHNKSLGASYESAWLACRLLAERYGEKSLIGFYRTADRTSSTTAAFRALGTTRGAFTAAWRADLRTLAG